MNGHMDEKDLYLSIGAKLKQYREAKGMSKTDVAKKSDISLTFLRRVEAGEKVSLITLKNILEAMELSLSDLFSDEKKNEIQLTLSGGDLSHVNGSTLDKIKATIELLLSPGKIMAKAAEENERKEREERELNGRDTANGYDQDEQYQQG